MPVGLLLVGVADPQDRTFVEESPGDVQAQRHALGIEPAGEGDRRHAGQTKDARVLPGGLANPVDLLECLLFGRPALPAP